jgi:hypothetical protein
MNKSRAQLQKAQFICKYTTVSDISSTSAKGNHSASADDMASTEDKQDFQLNTALLQKIKLLGELLRCITTSGSNHLNKHKFRKARKEF